MKGDSFELTQILQRYIRDVGIMEFIILMTIID